MLGPKVSGIDRFDCIYALSIEFKHALEASMLFQHVLNAYNHNMPIPLNMHDIFMHVTCLKPGIHYLNFVLETKYQKHIINSDAWLNRKHVSGLCNKTP